MNTMNNIIFHQNELDNIFYHESDVIYNHLAMYYSSFYLILISFFHIYRSKFLI